MKKNVKEVILNNEKEASILIASGIKQRKSDAKKYYIVNAMLNNLIESGINYIDVDLSCKKNQAFNLGTQAESLLRFAVLNDKDQNNYTKSLLKGVDGITKNGVEVEFKSMLKSASAEITKAVNLYCLVYKEANKGKEAVKGVYRISAKAIRDNNLIGQRLSNIDTITTYGVYCKGASERLGL